MWCFREECFSEIEPHLIELRARMKKVNADPSFEAKLAFIDNCCTKRAMWEKVFPYAKVKLDPRHWMDRMDEVRYATSQVSSSSSF